MRAALVAMAMWSGVAEADKVEEVDKVDKVDKEPPNRFQPKKPGAAALSHGVDECVASVKGSTTGTDGMLAATFCSCMFDNQRATAKDDLKRLTSATFDKNKIVAPSTACRAWAEKHDVAGPINNTPYSKALDLPTWTIIGSFVTCNATFEEHGVPEQTRIGFCSCMVDALRTQPSSTLAKVRKVKGGDYGPYLPAAKIGTCVDTFEMMKYQKP